MRSKKVVLCILLLLSTSRIATAQYYIWFFNTGLYRFTGTSIGYIKADSNFHTKTTGRLTCNVSSGYLHTVGLNTSGPGPEKAIVFFNNSDTTIFRKGYYDPIPPTPTFQNNATLAPMHLADKRCKPCTFNTSGNGSPPLLHEDMNEHHLDSFLTHGPINNAAISVPKTLNSITIYHGVFDIFSDHYSRLLRNVVPGGISFINNKLINNSYYTAPTHYFSRIYRYNAYSKISSPDAQNPHVILGLKNKVVTYNPGYFDKEGDSINVVPLLLYVSDTFAHPLEQFSGTPSALLAKIKSDIKNHTKPILYQPGFSPSNPFGPGSTFTLNNKTGEFSFSAPDTGLYLLTFRVEEYRNSQLLGDVMVQRLAMVTDRPNAILPVISTPFNITGTTAYNFATQTIYICADDTLNYTVKATSPSHVANIQIGSNALSGAPGSSVVYSGQGTDSATMTFTWRPTKAHLGNHYVYVDAVDTFCGNFPVHVSKGVTIVVQGAEIIADKSVLCKGDTLKLLSYTSGINTWTVMPGGDPYLPCTQCSSITVHPNITTSYILEKENGSCGARRDTFTVKVIPNYTIKATNDTAFTGPIPSNYKLDVQTLAPAPYQIISWSPWYLVDSAAIKSPKPVTTQSNNTYIVTVTDSFNCFTRKDTVVVKQNTAGVENVNAAKAIEVYPNPFSRSFNLKTYERGVLMLHDIEGRTIAEYKIHAGNNEITFPANSGEGIYIGRLLSEDGKLVQSMKLVYKGE